MVEEILKSLRAIEDKANKIIEEAKKNKFIIVSRAKKRAESLLSEASKALRSEAEAMIEEARTEAEIEKQKIVENNRFEIEQLQNKILPKIGEARALCR